MAENIISVKVLNAGIKVYPVAQEPGVNPSYKIEIDDNGVKHLGKETYDKHNVWDKIRDIYKHLETKI